MLLKPSKNDEKCRFKIDASMATSLLTGILTDSGRFLYDSSDDKTLYAASQLIKYGADKKALMKRLFQSEKFQAAQLQIQVLSRTEFWFDKVAMTYATLKDFEDFKLDASDLDGVVNYYRDTDKIVLSIFLKEKNDGYKVSFRSKGELDVNKIASSLGGGGHKNASGCFIKGDLEACRQQILKVLSHIIWTEY